jgi:hypothetical protein
LGTTGTINQKGGAFLVRSSTKAILGNNEANILLSSGSVSTSIIVKGTVFLLEQAYVVLQPVLSKFATIFLHKIPTQVVALVLQVELPVNLEATSFIYRITQEVLRYSRQVEQRYLPIFQ